MRFGRGWCGIRMSEGCGETLLLQYSGVGSAVAPLRKNLCDLLQDFWGNASLQIGIGFDQPRDVEKIFAAFGRAAIGIGGGPDFAFENILDACDRQRKAKNLARMGAIQKVAIARVRLNLNSQIRAGGGDVEAVWEFFDGETLFEKFSDFIELIDSHGEIEIKADQWFHVGVDSLTADYAKANATIVEQAQHSFEEIRFIHSDGFPEGKCFHGSAVLRLAQFVGLTAGGTSP